MASLTQARLAPLTQRYLTMSIRHLGKRENFVSAPGFDIVSHSLPALQAPHINGMTSKVTQSSTKNQCTGHRTNLTTIPVRQTDALRSLLSDSYSGAKMLFAPLKVYENILTTREQNQALTDRLASFRNDHSDGHSRYGHKRVKSYGNKPFFVMLGVLGLFKKPTAEELEEERIRLADEQKVKKMKPIELAIARGVLSMCDQNFGKANELLHEALHMAQDENDDARENLILNLMASNYFEGGDYANAEKLFIDLMKRMIAQDVAPTSPPILELSLKLASIYSKSPETQEKALKGFKFVIGSLLSNLDEIVSNIESLDAKDLSAEKRDELALLGWSYDWFAKHLLNMNDYSGAASMLRKAHEISTIVLGPLHDQTLILLNDIGTTLAMNNSPHEGKTYIKKAVDGAIMNESPELASFYVNLGLVDLKLRNLEEAKKSCEYSMELAKKSRDHYNSQEIIDLSKTCLNQVRRMLETERQ